LNREGKRDTKTSEEFESAKAMVNEPSLENQFKALTKQQIENSHSAIE
jgi:hypothetical protein